MLTFALSKRQKKTVGNLRLHLDADTSRVSLWRALLE